jgi:peptidoglycan/xylan/chitin deacetylase (PgdA/CDA1 family)
VFSLRKKFRQLFYGQCAILLYHRVTDIDTDPQLLAVKPENFDDHLALLKEKYHPLTIDQLTSKLIAGENLPDKSVAITFDDGYSDNYHEALPILKKNDLQALFYITTGNLDTGNEFWWDAMERILLLPPNLPPVLEINNHGERFSYDTSTNERRRNAYEQLLPILRRMRPESRSAIIDGIAGWSGNIQPRSTHRSMTFDELKRMSDSPNAVMGAHTHNHPSLAALTRDEQCREIVQSKQIVERITGSPVKHFSYPFGTWLDYNDDTISICRHENFEWVAANYPATADRKSDLFRIPRFLVRDWNVDEFNAQLINFFR